MLSTATAKKMSVEPSMPHLKNWQISHDNDMDFDYDFVFQPIVNFTEKTIFANEALIRDQESRLAETVLSKVSNPYLFDQANRVRAIQAAQQALLKGKLSINFMPNAVFNPLLSLLTTLKACENHHLPPQDIIFEFNEKALVENADHILKIGQEYKRMGFQTAIDDFGAGYSGLNFIANFQPDIVKIDMDLIRGIDKSTPRQAIIKAITHMCHDLGISIIAEGIETIAERDTLLNYGIDQFQGNLFCKPSAKSQGAINAAAWLS